LGRAPRADMLRAIMARCTTKINRYTIAKRHHKARPIGHAPRVTPIALSSPKPIYSRCAHSLWQIFWRPLSSRLLHTNRWQQQVQCQHDQKKKTAALLVNCAGKPAEMYNYKNNARSRKNRKFKTPAQDKLTTMPVL